MEGSLSVCLCMDEEEGVGLASLNPFSLPERLRQALSKDLAQTLRVVPEGLISSRVNQGQCSVTDNSLTLTIPGPLLFLAPGLLLGIQQALNKCLLRMAKNCFLLGTSVPFFLSHPSSCPLSLICHSSETCSLTSIHPVCCLRHGPALLIWPAFCTVT